MPVDIKHMITFEAVVIINKNLKAFADSTQIVM